MKGTGTHTSRSGGPLLLLGVTMPLLVCACGAVSSFAAVIACPQTQVLPSVPA